MHVYGVFWSAFSRIRTECRIQSECGKMLIRKTQNTDTFYAVIDFSVTYYRNS